MEAKGECTGEKKEFERECAASWVSLSLYCLVVWCVEGETIEHASSIPPPQSELSANSFEGYTTVVFRWIISTKEE